MPFSLRGVNNQGLLKILLQFSTWAVHEKATLHCNYHISTLLSSPMQCIHFLKLIWIRAEDVCSAQFSSKIWTLFNNILSAEKYRSRGIPFQNLTFISDQQIRLIYVFFDANDEMQRSSATFSTLRLNNTSEHKTVEVPATFPTLCRNVTDICVCKFACGDCCNILCSCELFGFRLWLKTHILTTVGSLGWQTWKRYKTTALYEA